METKFTYLDGRGDKRSSSVPLASGDAAALRAEFRLAIRARTIPDAIHWLKRHEAPALKRLTTDQLRRIAVLCVRNHVEVLRG